MTRIPEDKPAPVQYNSTIQRTTQPHKPVATEAQPARRGWGRKNVDTLEPAAKGGGRNAQEVAAQPGPAAPPQKPLTPWDVSPADAADPPWFSTARLQQGELKVKHQAASADVKRLSQKCDPDDPRLEAATNKLAAVEARMNKAQRRDEIHEQVGAVLDEAMLDNAFIKDLIGRMTDAETSPEDAAKASKTLADLLSGNEQVFKVLEKFGSAGATAGVTAGNSGKPDDAAMKEELAALFLQAAKEQEAEEADITVSPVATQTRSSTASRK